MCFSLVAARRRAGAHQRSRLRGKTFPGLLRTCCAGDFGALTLTRTSRSSRSTARRRRARARIAAAVAHALGFHYLDSGALYRLVALAALGRGVELDDADAHRRARRSDLRRALRDGERAARRRGRHRRDPHRGVPARPPREVAALPRGAHGAARAPARLPARRPGWSPTGATWAPSSSPTPRSRCS